MRLLRASAGLIMLGLTGCGYVHFGRLPAAPAGDAKLAAAYSDLALEQKMLKQELALARKEGDTLRLALERAGAGSGAADTAALVAQLNASARELAVLRAKFGELERAKAKAAEPAANASPGMDSELQAENTRLRGELERARAENAQLSTKLAATREDLARARSDLLALKHAPAQPETTLARRDADPVNAAASRASGIMASLQLAKAPPADTVARANATPSASAPRVHVVQPGETLEGIAQRYFGSPARARDIAEANAATLPAGAELRPGMELRIPAK